MRPRIAELCAGYTGLGMAIGEVLGGELTLVADNDPGASAILAHRFPSVPNYTDITTADWTAAGPADILAAGFPCQPVSLAGKQLGEADERWIWPSVVRAVRDLRPGLVFLENVSALVVRGLAGVAADLAQIGYLGSWCCLRASDVGAPHRRERIFILAWPAADTAGAVQRRDGCGRPAQPRAQQGQSRRPQPEPDDSGLAPADAECNGLQGCRPAARADAGRPGAASVRCRPADSGPATEDPDRAASGERRQPAPGQEAGGRAWTDSGGPGGMRLAADADRQGWQGAESAPRHLVPARSAAAWGVYAPAIRRWERATGRPAPRPTEPGRTGERLSPRFVEWMMGLPEGWVTDVPGLSRNAQLKALGNGVVPQQAAMALRLLLDRSGLLPLVAADLTSAEGGEAA